MLFLGLTCIEKSIKMCTSFHIVEVYISRATMQENASEDNTKYGTKMLIRLVHAFSVVAMSCICQCNEKNSNAWNRFRMCTDECVSELKQLKQPCGPSKNLPCILHGTTTYYGELYIWLCLCTVYLWVVQTTKVVQERPRRHAMST